MATGPVSAFSTLGWFADPVLNTFLGRREEDLAALIFHELSHQVLYVKGDTVFNESFATAVEILGQQRWLEAQGRPDAFDQLQAERDAEGRFVDLVLGAREELAAVYASGDPEDELSRRKALAFEKLKTSYLEARHEWDPEGRYASWFDRQLNNAHLAQVGSYYGEVPAFLQLFAETGSEFPAFYEAARELASRGLDERSRDLAVLSVRAETLSPAVLPEPGQGSR